MYERISSSSLPYGRINVFSSLLLVDTSFAVYAYSSEGSILVLRREPCWHGEEQLFLCFENARYLVTHPCPFAGSINWRTASVQETQELHTQLTRGNQTGPLVESRLVEDSSMFRLFIADDEDYQFQVLASAVFITDKDPVTLNTDT